MSVTCLLNLAILVVYAAAGKCRCNALGSLATTCDPQTSQCRCKQGVGGLRCDRCEPSYWGLQLIADTPANGGCIREFIQSIANCLNHVKGDIGTAAGIVSEPQCIDRTPKKSVLRFGLPCT